MHLFWTAVVTIICSAGAVFHNYEIVTDCSFIAEFLLWYNNNYCNNLQIIDKNDNSDDNNSYGSAVIILIFVIVK